jgi:BirA family biotin operon repressor/biotin-[acetyl-CoA-carboxylase] ligase
MEGSEILSLEVIEASLSTKIIGRAQHLDSNLSKNELWDEIDSTNTRAAALAAQGCPEGVMVIARQQTAGRGRLGRAWISPPDAGISFSVVLRPKIELSRLPLITLATGVAVAQAIEASVGVRPGLKWVNDLTLSGRKLGGILAEMPGQALIIGIGINVRLKADELPEELKDKVEWLERAVGGPVDPNLVVMELAHKLETQYELLKAGKTEEILGLWRAYSVTLGQMIEARSANQVITGKAIDIADSGALIVEAEDGTRTELVAGEISLRLQDGSYC